MEGMTPGRIIHYVSHGSIESDNEPGAHRAGIITEVVGRRNNPFFASLCVFKTNGMYFKQAVEYDDETKRPGTWHFPERV